MNRLFTFVHQEASTLSTVIKAESEVDAREELNRRLKSITFELHINIPLEQSWELIGTTDVNQTREIKAII